MTFLRTTLEVFLKDLRIELRSREIVLSTALFALLVVLLSAFAFDLNTISPKVAGPGVLWIAIAFGGILALSRSFEREKDFGVWNGLMMTPAPRSAIYLGKVLGTTLFLTLIELMLLVAVDLFLHTKLIAHIAWILPILLLGTVGYAAVGTLFASMSVRTRLKDLLLGTILYPLISPVLIMAVKATASVLEHGGGAEAVGYMEFLVVLDAIFVVGGLWLFGPLMED